MSKTTKTTLFSIGATVIGGLLLDYIRSRKKV
jgi:hypothetical protein